MAPLSDEALHTFRQPTAASRRDNHNNNVTVPLVYPCGYAGAEEDWIPNVMLRGCQTKIYCLSEIARGVENGDHAEGAIAIAPGSVIVLQSQQMPLLRMLARLYKAPLRSLVLIHISDGNIWNERVAETARLYSEWGYAFRQYWLPDAPHDSLERAAARGDVEWFPIGMNPQWVKLLPELASGRLPRPAASQRRHVISFLGSTDKSERQTRIEAVSRAVAPLGIRVHHRQGNVGCYGQGCSDMDYVHETLDSALCLSLPGSSVESNRLYESLEGGCIPLVVRHFGPGEAAVGTAVETGPRAIELVKAALSPLDLVTGAPPPFLVVDYEAELPDALGELLASPEALDAMQQRVLSWWAAAKDHYAAAFQRAVCPV